MMFPPAGASLPGRRGLQTGRRPGKGSAGRTTACVPTIQAAHFFIPFMWGPENHMPEQTGSVAVQDRETERPTVLRPEGANAVPPLEIHPEQKCPYLAGRPPHGSYHLWPSGVNVCYARGADGRTYGHASKETQ